MKKFFSYLFSICAIVSFALLLYQAIPVFPYIKDTGILLSALAFLVFYYLAYKASRPKKDSELT